jgi:hypothetical protein
VRATRPPCSLLSSLRNIGVRIVKDDKSRENAEVFGSYKGKKGTACESTPNQYVRTANMISVGTSSGAVYPFKIATKSTQAWRLCGSGI